MGRGVYVVGHQGRSEGDNTDQQQQQPVIKHKRDIASQDNVIHPMVIQPDDKNSGETNEVGDVAGQLMKQGHGQCVTGNRISRTGRY